MKNMILKLALIIVAFTGYALLEIQILDLQQRNVQLMQDMKKLSEASIDNSHAIVSLSHAMGGR